MELNILVKRKFFEPFSKIKNKKISWTNIRGQATTKTRLTHSLNENIKNLAWKSIGVLIQTFT